MVYFTLIRIVELNNLDRILTDRRLKTLFGWVFLPTYTFMTVCGFKWFLQAAHDKCYGKDTDDGNVYILVLIASLLRCFMLIMLAALLISKKVTSALDTLP
jgi:hypothetical protein